MQIFSSVPVKRPENILNSRLITVKSYRRQSSNNPHSSIAASSNEAGESFFNDILILDAVEVKHSWAVSFGEEHPKYPTACLCSSSSGHTHRLQYMSQYP